MKKKINLPSDKKFGFFFSIIFICFSIYFFYNERSILFYLFLILFLTFFLVTIINDRLLNPFNKCWTYLGILLGKIFSPIVLGVIFFLIVTPYALFFKLIGRDELNLKKKEINKSYWTNSYKLNKLDMKYFRRQF